MKHLITLILFLSFTLTNAQDITGEYKLEHRGTNAIVSRTLTLKADGTFLFHSYEKHDQRIIQEVHAYGRGTWKQNKKVISFFTEASDMNAIHTLNFNASKARYNSKSPRDKSDRDIKTSIQFYKTDVMIAQGLKLIKE